MPALPNLVSFKPGTHCVYAWKSSGGRRLIYCRIESFEGATVTIRLPLRNQPGHILLVVPLDRSRFQVLPNRLVSRAKESYQLRSVKDLPAALRRAVVSGDAPIPAAVAALSAVGVYTGAEALSRYQFITLGYKGTAHVGVLGLAALPGVLFGGYALKKVAELENDPVTAAVSKLGIVAGNVAGLAAVAATVSKAGPVAGLSGRGVATGLVALGRGRGTTVGLAYSAGIFSVSAAVVSGAVWGLTRYLRQTTVDNEYRKFVDRWRNSGYKSVSEGVKVEIY